MKEKAKRNNKGITLVALIITIIIMLILVGVSIQIVINSNLLGVAQNAGEKTKTAYEEEGNLSGIEIGGVKYDSIEDYLNNNPSSSIKIKLSMVNTPVAVTADGTKVKAITEGAPIPVDFYYVGGTKNTGIVISDNSADENAGVDADLQGNQFVWVPVLQNQKLKIEIESEEEITSIKIEDALLNEITTDKEGNTLAPSGTSYITEVNPTINGTYTVTVTAGEETIEKKLRVSSLYAQDFFLQSIQELKADYTIEEFTQNYSDYEGNVVEEWLEEEYGTTSIEEAYEMSMQAKYEESLEWGSEYIDTTIATYSNSVNKYGGFYIARYEAGSETVRSEGDELGTAYSKKNMYPYNWISQANAINQASGMYNKTNVTSALINAAAWDRTLNWIVETNNTMTIDDIVKDSIDWGNYRNNNELSFAGKYSSDYGDSFTEATTSTLKPENTAYLLGTGVSEKTRKNNIYDLAGNCNEWTTEAVSSGYVVCRGGVCYGDGNLLPASDRNDVGASGGSDDISFRPALYINVN